MNAPNFRVEMKAPRTARVEIYDALGPSWAGMIDAKTVSGAIGAAGELDEIEVRINSPGGSVWEGLAINNILKSHPAQVHVKVDGVAASAATLVMMAGDTVEIPKNAMFMVHEPSTFAWGDEKALLKAAEMLVKARDSALETYLAKNKVKTRAELAAMMAEETWMLGEEAVAAGFADTVGDELPVAAASPTQIRYEYQKAPSQFASLLGLAMSARPNPQLEPNPMATDTKTPEQLAAEKAANDKAVADAQASADAAAKTAADAAVKAERERSTEIHALCQQAGHPELAGKLLEAGTSVADAQKTLLAKLCEERKLQADGEPETGGGNDPDAKYKQEYADNRANFVKNKLSEADYIRSRRRDDGAEMLIDFEANALKMQEKYRAA